MSRNTVDGEMGEAALSHHQHNKAVACEHRMDYLVDERKAGDELFAQAVSTVGHIVTEELHDSKHGKTSVLKFLSLTLERSDFVKFGHTNFVAAEVSVLFDSSDSEEDLGPSQNRDNSQSIKTVGDISELKSEREFTRESNAFLEDVSKNSQLGNTSVLQFDSTVAVESGLVLTTGKSSRICTGRE